MSVRVALGTACGVLAGVLLVVVLGGRTEVRTETRTVTVNAAVTTGGTVVVTTAVPDLVGQRLDVAKERLARAKFEADVDGGGVLGIVVDGNWEVVAQRPPGGTQLEQGSSVRLDVVRR